MAMVLCLMLLYFSTTELKMLSWFLWSSLRNSLHVHDYVDGYCDSGETDVWKVKPPALTMI